MKTLLLLTLFIGQLFASDLSGGVNKNEVFPVAIIVKIDGKAKILPFSSIKKHTALVGEGLMKGDKLISYANTKVLIRLLDESKIVLNENAEMLLSDNSTIRQESGEVYYKINKRTKSAGLKVETPFSIIGIKGTEFIVNFEHEGEIALNEGLVGITSPGKEFELYKEKQLSEFEKYQQQQDADFEAYKRKTEDRIAAYVQSFNLHANKMLTFRGSADCAQNCEKRIDEDDFSKEIIARFKTYQELVGN